MADSEPSARRYTTARSAPVAPRRPGASWTERFYTPLEATLYPDFVSPVEGEGGRFRVPTGPGLGADPDPDVIRDYRVAD